MTQEDKLKRARQLLKHIITNQPTYNEGSGELCCYCHRYTKDGNVVDDTPEAHAVDCLIMEITRFLLEE